MTRPGPTHPAPMPPAPLCVECGRRAPEPGERCRHCGHECARHLDVRVRVDQLRAELARTQPGTDTAAAIEADLADALRAHLEPDDDETRRAVLRRVRRDRADLRRKATAA